MTKYILIALLVIGLCSCGEEDYIPKPRGYFQIDFPEKKYMPFNQAGYPYTFDYPTYANVEKDTLFFNEKTENPWWININFHDLGGKIYLSYKQIGPNQTLAKLLEDSYQMSHYHTDRKSVV